MKSKKFSLLGLFGRHNNVWYQIVNVYYTPQLYHGLAGWILWTPICNYENCVSEIHRLGETP